MLACNHGQSRLLLLSCLTSYVWSSDAFPISTLYARTLDKTSINNSTGTPIVYSNSGSVVTQGTASDGAGVGFSLPALIWIIYCFALGVPLAFAGIRGWRLTTGVSLGIAMAVCAWAAIVNTETSISPLTDMELDVIVWGASGAGFVFGLFEVGRLAGIIAIGVSGGLSFGTRIVLMGDGLIVPGENLYLVNWVIVGFLGIIGGLTMIYKQRVGILFGCAAAGTFLIALGGDLIVNQQKGMSQGLRFLFDQNSSHIINIIETGYTPPMSTRIIMGASLALTFPLAFGQHKLFKDKFNRNKTDDEEDFADINPLDFSNPETRLPRDKAHRSFFNVQKSRFSHF